MVESSHLKKMSFENLISNKRILSGTVLFAPKMNKYLIKNFSCNLLSSQNYFNWRKSNEFLLAL
jgi:hypothetical protein